jgi:hypothetical protein
MKTKKLIISSLIAFMFTSCITNTNFYQVYKTIPESNIKLKDSMLVYEDDNCKVLYNLWNNGGNIGFQFQNKTETNIYLNLEECFFINNGFANNYYKNRVYTSISNYGLTQSAAKSISGLNYLNLIQTNSASENTISSSGRSVSTTEEKIICIPAYTSKVINEYSIKQTLYRDCDLLRYPSKKEIKTLTFTKANSPMTYSNRIEYKVGQNGTPIKFENNFFISEITNYPESEITVLKPNKFCGQETIEKTNTKYFKKVSPNMFYIQYNQTDIWRH